MIGIAQILHKRPFQTAATLITLCEGQSKGKMTRAVMPDTHNAQMAAVRWWRREVFFSGDLKDAFWDTGSDVCETVPHSKDCASQRGTVIIFHCLSPIPNMTQNSTTSAKWFSASKYGLYF